MLMVLIYNKICIFNTLLHPQKYPQWIFVHMNVVVTVLNFQLEWINCYHKFTLTNV